MPGVLQPIHIFPEAPARVHRAQRGQCVNDRAIALDPIDHRPVVRGPIEPGCLTGPLNRKATLTDHVGHHLPSLSSLLELFYEDIFQGRILQRQVRIHALETAVSLFEFFQLSDVGRLSPLPSSLDVHL